MMKKKDLLDLIKEMQNPQPSLNLNAVNKQSLPQITTGLQNIVRAQDQLKQQQKMLQQQMVSKHTPNTMPVMGEMESMTTHNQDLSPMGMSDKNSPSDPIPTPMAGDQATQGGGMLEQGGIPHSTEDHIDDLLYHYFGFTYFNDKSKPEIIRKKDIQQSLFPEPNKSATHVKMWKNMGDVEKNELISTNYKMRDVMNLLDSGDTVKAFTTLNRVVQQLQENTFVDSKMFSIIAENEAPRISKKDFINHIKNRKK